MKKYIVEILKDHQITIDLEALQVNGNDIPNTARNIIFNREAGIRLFKTAKEAKLFVENGNGSRAGAYIYKGIQP